MLRSCLLFSLLLLSGCASKAPNGREVADQIAFKHSFEKKLIATEQFVITTYQKNINPATGKTIIYLEGDGRIIHNGFILPDPTPTKPMLLSLAAIDPRQNVIYMARPCQYTPKELNPSCTKEYWTDKRLSPEVILSLNQAINKIANNNKIELVGFSGGGGAAVLIAAQNPKVERILTIAANLDTKAFSKYHNAPEMAGSLNPIDYTAQIARIPQLHIAGDSDKIVPAFIVENFVAKSSSSCVHYILLNNVSHNKGWQENWQDILSKRFFCN